MVSEVYELQVGLTCNSDEFTEFCLGKPLKSPT